MSGSLSVIIDALRDAGLFVGMHGALPKFVTDVVDDSRAVTAGSAFVAVKGSTQDGHTWLPSAAAAGAAMAFVEDESGATLPCVTVRDGRRAASVVASAFHGWPARALTIVGVTGTNGKTTTVGLLRSLLDRPDAPAASIGTLGVLLGAAGELFPGGAGLTTPGPVELQRVLAALVARGVATVAMEVSSHSLDQRRVDGVTFAAAVFTNLTRDHLDYHGSMDAYRRAKLRLLGLLAADGVAVRNADDEAWADIDAPRTLSFGVHGTADVSARDLRFTPHGSEFLLVAPTGALPVTLPLLGDFNVANALAAASVALVLGLSVAEIAAGLNSAPQTPGRLELLHTGPTVLRDYAHTPDALERALGAVRPFTRDDAGGRLIVVFGCGGDRDRGKRPVMGRVAETFADVVLLTSDNPRTEDPERILDDIVAGMTTAKFTRIEDRRAAIAHALSIAQPQDVVLLAGKGHETYQIRGTTSYPFDERQIVRELTAAQLA
ncbi:MAG TPA: UDP-N-acetylmuramoyl-L-alanyl-D-glutamate--2,6-diaminopimelate ligase [Gemmatimonas sp.]|nr:UDP-N-acetylmuramoyl-L-alanyl-D-glutamate--2,6-diaminopimelate ligase [Gemmatimonas sp.]